MQVWRPADCVDTGQRPAPVGNMAFAHTDSKGEVTVLEPGITLPEENRELFVFKKVNGTWKIYRYMFNKMAPKAA